MKKNLPPLRNTVKIKFSSLRNAIGCGLGVIPDADAEIERECYRVSDGDSWKWQIKAINTICKWDYYAHADQEILDSEGSNLEFQYVNRQQSDNLK